MTRLVQLTAPELLVQLWPVVLGIARLIYRFRQSPHTPAKMFQFENDLQELLREAGRRIVQWTLNHLEPTDPQLLPRELFYQTDHFRRKSRSPFRNLNCLFGNIRVWRWLYEPTESPLPSLFPLQLQLGTVTDAGYHCREYYEQPRISAIWAKRFLVWAVRRMRGQRTCVVG